MRKAARHFRYHPEACEDFLMESPAVAAHLKARPRPATAGLRYGLPLPSSLFLSSRPRRGRLALGLPRFGSSFGSVIPRERPITFQLGFQDNRLMFFENQSRLELLLAPLSIFTVSRSSITSLPRAGEPFTIRLKM